MPVTPIGKPKPSEYKIEGVKLKDFFEKRFVELLDSKIGHVGFEHVCLVKFKIKEDEKEEIADRLVIGHESYEEEKNSIITIGARKSDTCEKLVEVVSSYFEEKAKDEGE